MEEALGRRTGTVVLVTNEGNGRMVTSLPRIHVAVMGVEKIVPSMSDLVVFLASPRASYISGAVIPVDGGLRRYQF